MNWDLLFCIYTAIWVMIGWPVEKALKRVLKPTTVWLLGMLLLLLNLLVFLRQGNWFAGNAPSGLGLRFVLYPALILGLLSCYDGISYYVSRLLGKDENQAGENVSTQKEIE